MTDIARDSNGRALTYVCSMEDELKGGKAAHVFPSFHVVLGAVSYP